MAEGAAVASRECGAAGSRALTLAARGLASVWCSSSRRCAPVAAEKRPAENEKRLEKGHKMPAFKHEFKT